MTGWIWIIRDWPGLVWITDEIGTIAKVAGGSWPGSALVDTSQNRKRMARLEGRIHSHLPVSQQASGSGVAAPALPFAKCKLLEMAQDKPVARVKG